VAYAINNLHVVPPTSDPVEATVHMGVHCNFTARLDLLRFSEFPNNTCYKVGHFVLQNGTPGISQHIYWIWRQLLSGARGKMSIREQW